MVHLLQHPTCRDRTRSPKVPIPMKKTVAHSTAKRSMALLSYLVLTPRDCDEASLCILSGLHMKLRNIQRREFDELVALANSNHVIVRTLEVFLGLMLEAKDDTRAQWAEAALAVERARISTALTFLKEICTALKDESCDVVVIKSLDHLPDLGSDLDLYTTVAPERILDVMTRRFSAQIAPRSWGDRLACKWNFLIPGLSEAVEIHMGRLGQTGEQVAIASSLTKRTRRVLVCNHAFEVPSVSDRIMISALQRMYRHFYFRLCDIVDTTQLADAGVIDYKELRAVATDAGIWDGVATYLVIVSAYVASYRGEGIELPKWVVAVARFGGAEIYYAREYLRVPIMPQSITLYGSQLASLWRQREIRNCARLSLLPWLATAAAVGHKVIGSDKGIW